MFVQLIGLYLCGSENARLLKRLSYGCRGEMGNREMVCTAGTAVASDLLVVNHYPIARKYWVQRYAVRLWRSRCFLAQFPKLIDTKIILRIVSDVWFDRFHQLKERRVKV